LGIITTPVIQKIVGYEEKQMRVEKRSGRSGFDSNLSDSLLNNFINNSKLSE
jgi:hypothetical protein